MRLLMLLVVSMMIGGVESDGGCCARNHKECHRSRVCNSEEYCGVILACGDSPFYFRPLDNQIQTECLDRFSGGPKDSATACTKKPPADANARDSGPKVCCGDQLVCNQDNDEYHHCELITATDNQYKELVEASEAGREFVSGNTFTGCCSFNHRDCLDEGNYCNFEGRCMHDAACKDGYVWLYEDETTDASGELLDDFCLEQYAEGCTEDAECCADMQCYEESFQMTSISHCNTLAIINTHEQKLQEEGSSI